METKGSRKRNNNDPISFNSIFDEGFVKGRGEGYKKGYAKGRQDKGQNEESIHLKIMNEWKNLKLLMVHRQQLNMLLVNISPYDAFKRKMNISQTNPFARPQKKIDNLVFFYNVLDSVETKMIKTRLNLRKLYKNEVINSKIGILFDDDRIVSDISHAMENSFIIPLSQLFKIDNSYIKPYLTFLYYKFPQNITASFIKEASNMPLNENDPLDGLIKQMLNYIDAENNTFAPIINAIDDNDVKGLQSAIESYIDKFPPIKVGAPVTPVSAQNSRKTFASRKANADAKTKKSKSKSKSKSPKGTSLPNNGGVSL